MSELLLFLKCYLLPGLLFLGGGSLLAQADTILIEAVEVTAARFEHQDRGENIQSWSKKTLERYQSANLGELLDQEGGVFIKSYGIGSLATSSLQGGSAGHTALNWNGLPINSPMLGPVGPGFVTGLLRRPGRVAVRRRKRLLGQWFHWRHHCPAEHRSPVGMVDRAGRYRW